MKAIMKVIIAFALSAPVCHAMQEGFERKMQQFVLNENEMALWLIPSMHIDNVTFAIFNEQAENRESLKANVLHIFKALLAQGRNDREIKVSYKEPMNSNKVFFTITWYPTHKEDGPQIQWSSKDQCITAINATFRFYDDELKIYTATEGDDAFFNDHLPAGFRISRSVIPMPSQLSSDTQ